MYKLKRTGRGKALPLQAWTGPEGSSMLRLPQFLDSRHMKMVKLSALLNSCFYSSGYIPGPQCGRKD